jgi:hypothetical protein
MTKKTSWYVTVAVLITAVVLALSACGKQTGFSPVFMVDANGIYSGFSDVTESLDIEKAETLGYVAIDGQLIVKNSGIWENFVSQSARGNNSSVRLVYFYTNKSVYIIDVFYNNGQYYLFDSSVEVQNTDGFDHLLRLEGSFGMPKRDTVILLLADDESITFDQYMTAMFSSNTEVIQSVQPSRLIMLMLPEN